MKVAFLDCDGVLNHGRLYRSLEPKLGSTVPADWIDPECVARVNEICRRTGAVIVISSSWRYYLKGHVGVAAVLAQRGLTAAVIDGTPPPEDGRLDIRGTRWGEVSAWLELHPEVTQWVAIDDCAIRGFPPEHFVRTDMTVGLTDGDAERAIAILGELRPPKMRPPKMPVVGDVVSYSMIRKMYSPVEAIVTATSRENPALTGMQIRVLIHGKKNQHPTGAIDYNEKPMMGDWSWPEDRDRAIETQRRAEEEYREAKMIAAAKAVAADREEPSRKQMREALEACEKFLAVRADEYDHFSEINPSLLDQEPIAVLKLAKDALRLVRAALGRDALGRDALGK